MLERRFIVNEKNPCSIFGGYCPFVQPGNGLAKLAPGDFIDLKGHWAENNIQAAVNLGLMNGSVTAQGFKVFAPEGIVSRAQLATVLVETFSLDYGTIRFIKAPLASDYYRDVNNTAWYAGAVLTCAINNIFDRDDHFNPDQAVSRLEIARAIYRCFNAKGISVPTIMVMPTYQDTSALAAEDMTAVAFVSNTGIMRGDGKNFRPAATVKRGELARVLNSCIPLMVLNENYNGKEYRVTTGQTLNLSLASNPNLKYL